ncbi:AfsR/SARP family transcriptional regulator [Nocardia carnea]|uniref:AfsR/SARP family transcriptional regulator n=1 Tax=Nocardia carnea TaxID=37328 RepID=UPI0024538F44|nr:BTAD domain-containing putative transcriptional regulator [Nocardia carnea]
MQFRVLGPLRIQDRGREYFVSGRLQQALLGVLLARAGTVVPQDLLIDALWGGRAGLRAGARLHVTVHRLRERLPTSAQLLAEGRGYTLRVDPECIDAARFESLLEQASTSDPQRAAEQIRAALRLWRGDPYEGVDTPLLNGEAKRLERRRSTAVEDLYVAELASGRHTAVLAELTDAVLQHPLQERLHALLMISLYRSGRQSAALEVYRRARDHLVGELGQEPGPELREIERQILAGGPVRLPDAGERAVPRPAQLLGDISGFCGRQAELAALDKILEDRVDDSTLPLVAVVTGTAGVGKTALVRHWAASVRGRFPDGQLYADFHAYGPDPELTPGEVLAGFLRALGVAGPDIPAGTDERAALFRTVIDRRRILIVLDNVASAQQVRPLLPGDSTCLVIVTSRDSLPGLAARDGALRVSLDRLVESESLELLHRSAGSRIQGYPEAAGTLIRRCAGLPLTVRLMAELVNETPAEAGGQPIVELAAELAGHRSALQVLDAGGDTGTDVRAVLSWSYHKLAPDAAHGFRLIGLHPGYDFDEAAVGALLGVEEPKARSVLRMLRRAHVVEVSDGRYSMHDLLRSYAVELSASEDFGPEREPASNRLLDHYAAAAAASDEDSHHSTRWFEDERRNLGLVAQLAVESRRFDVAIQLSGALRGRLRYGAHHDEALVIHRAAVDAAAECGDPLAEGTASRYLGSTYRRLGRLDDAHGYMERAYRCFERAGARHEVLLQAGNLGTTYTWLGRYRDAVRLLRHGISLAEELGSEGRLGRAAALVYLGQAYMYLGDPGRALTCALEGLAGATEVNDSVDGAEPARSVAFDAETLAGLALVRLDRYGDAQPHLERALESGNSTLHAYLTPLALVYQWQGRKADAYAHARHCLSLATGFRERVMEPEVRITLGELYQRDDEPARALTEFRAAAAVAADAGLRYHRARAELLIGDVLDSLIDRPGARRAWESALEIWTATGSADAEIAAARLRDTR